MKEILTSKAFVIVTTVVGSIILLIAVLYAPIDDKESIFSKALLLMSGTVVLEILFLRR